MNKIGILQGRLTAADGRGIQFFPSENWQEEFHIAKRIGFDCMELLVKKENYKDNPLFHHVKIAEIKKLKAETNIDTLSVHGFYSKEDWYPQILSKLIQNAKKVGANVVLVSFSKENFIKNSDDETRARTQLFQPLKEAERCDISIAIEIERVAETLKPFVDSFHSKALGVYYDIGNMASMGVDLKNEIELLGNLIKGVHVKDRKKNGGPTVPLGEGDANFAEAFDAFGEIGYDGPYIVQGARVENSDDILLNKKYLDFITGKLS